MRNACALTLLLLSVGSPAVRAQAPPSDVPPSAVRVDYDQHVKPILAAKCFSCHGAKQQQ